MLDFQAKPGVGFVAGLQEVTIVDFSGADVRMPNYLRGYPVLHELAKGCPDVAPPPPDCRSPVPIVGLNCSGNPGCELDGLTIIASSGYEGANGPRTAVRVYGSGTASKSLRFGTVPSFVLLLLVCCYAFKVMSASIQPRTLLPHICVLHTDFMYTAQRQ